MIEATQLKLGTGGGNDKFNICSPMPLRALYFPLLHVSWSQVE
jgi:hypothetical protein